ncbi:MAG: hypothetical protein CMJ18_18100 [Phycisphaeraceae bacterium]|nr:hypothetical protein [Phycisphaeraceae bacterium]
MLVVGGGAVVRGLPPRLASLLGMDLRPLTPCDLSACAPSIQDRCRAPGLVAALGLALHEGEHA